MGKAGVHVLTKQMNDTLSQIGDWQMNDQLVVMAQAELDIGMA